MSERIASNRCTFFKSLVAVTYAAQCALGVTAIVMVIRIILHWK